MRERKGLGGASTSHVHIVHSASANPHTSGSTTSTTSVLPLYESQPPKWLPKLHLTADIGYPGFHPPRPGQDEDLLTPANVRNGFSAPPHVSVEHFSAQSMITDSLHSGDVFSKLEDLMNEVFSRKAERIPAVPPPSFRIPPRVTLNDAKRQAWLVDLADPDVPLYKLGKSVPHAAKSHELVDLLYSNNVSIPRAVWFIRVFGANETAGLRTRPTYNPGQYSIESANIITGYMKKQLAEIALPSAPRPGINVKHTFKGVLADPETRERWISRFTYGLQLLRPQYSEGLVDKRTFLTWLVQQLSSCHLAQAGFITRLADEYLDDIVHSRALSRSFVEAALSKLHEIRTTYAQNLLTDTGCLLVVLLQRICLSIPDAFVSPRLWSARGSLLQETLTENVMDSTNEHIEQQAREIRNLLVGNLFDIQRRNDAMLFRNLPPHISTDNLGSAVNDVKLLNSISSTSDLSNLTFFTNVDSSESPGFVTKLNLLLTWSITPLQYGDHRPLACVTILKFWRDKANKRASRRCSAPPDEVLQDYLFDWLDTSEVAGEPENVRDVALLYGKLIANGSFSYTAYVQRLIVRGEPGISLTKGESSRHRSFLLGIPLSDVDVSLTMQRKVTLYGPRVREIPEDANERAIRKQIRALLPELFGGDLPPIPKSIASLVESCNIFISASRYEQVRTLGMWLLPIIQRAMTSGEPNVTHTALLRIYSITTELLSQAKCFHMLLDLTLAVLYHASNNDLLISVIDTLHRYSIIWACMDAMGRIATALDDAHQVWRNRGVRSRHLLSLLLEFDNGRFLNEASRERLYTDINGLTLALQPIMEQPAPVPSTLPDISLLLSEDADPKAPTDLATGLWIKYRSSEDWAWKVWDNTVSSLRQVPIMTTDPEVRRAIAIRYGVFLCHIDQHVPHGIDNEVLKWFMGPGKVEILGLSAEVWDVLTIVLLYLSIHGALRTTTILGGLVYPVWHMGASASQESTQTMQAIETLISACNNLCGTLLLQEEGHYSLPSFPINLFDIQCIHTRRKEVFSEPHFPSFVSCIPILILLENNPHVSEELRTESTSLRLLLCQDRDCRQGAHRNLTAIRDAFEQSLQLMDQNAGDVSRSIVSGLRILLGDSSEDIDVSNWPAITSLLSPWKIAATTLQFQFLLRQMGRALPQDASAGNALDKLTLMIFRHSMSSEEAYYVAQMARGVDGAVAGKFVNNGLRCIGEMLKEGSWATGTLSERLKRASELLRVLVYLVEPLRDDPPSIPTIEPIIQDAFFTALCAQITTVEQALTLGQQELRITSATTLNNGTPSIELPATQEVILLARLLQFDLGFRGIWTPTTLTTGASIVSSLLKLLLFFGGVDNLDLTAYPLLFDTLIYLLDEIPSPDPKPPPAAEPVNFFRHYPNISVTDLPAELPGEFRAQLLTLLPHLPPVAAVENLVVSSHRDASGNLVFGPPVVNRPWEWIENLGEPQLLDPKEEEKEREERRRIKAKYLVKNTGSLPLENFGARLTGEGIPTHRLFDEPSIPPAGRPLTMRPPPQLDERAIANIRLFEDRLSSESVFTRDWKETRIDFETHLIDTSSVSKGTTSGPTTGMFDDIDMMNVDKTYPPSRGSPASSIISRSSASGGRSSITAGGNSSTSKMTTSDIIDVDAFVGSGRPTEKRKAVDDESDDEVIIIEGPSMRPSMSQGLMGGGTASGHPLAKKAKTAVKAGVGVGLKSKVGGQITVKRK